VLHTSVPGRGRFDPPSFPAKAAMGSVHRPVLVDEIASWLSGLERPGAILVDGTAGGGGHLVAMARLLGPGGRVIGLDRDPKMLALAVEAVRDAGESDRVTLVHAAYCEMRDVLEQNRIEGVDAIILDLGLSSDQLGWEDRGFSFASDGPLDMRFDADEDIPTAAGLVNQLPETELANLFFEFGEERFSRRIARRVVEERKKERIGTTGRLAEIVRRAMPGRARAGHIDPATRVFQALRIAVNDELGQLDATLAAIPGLLVPGGRAAVVSFHSLEDRRVKWAFKTCPELKVLTKKPVTATAQEVASNPRARSAKLRVVEKCPNPS
jgi:16S rRNA (cytosine1402-N4)-methyltransferase